MNKLHPLKVIGIMIILFGLPLGSWFFMKSGADFRMAAIEELGDYGTIKDFELLAVGGDDFTIDDVSKKVLMVNFIDYKDFKGNKVVDQLKWVQNQFQERLLKRNDFMFLTHVKIDSISQLNNIQKQIDEEKNGNYRRWYLVGGDTETLESLAEDSYHLPLKNDETVFNNPYLAIVDMDKDVRYHYNLFKKEEIAKLMMHLSILLPQQDDRKVEIKTEAKN